MSPAPSVYKALLFRGWEWVRLDYELRDDAVTVRRKHTWSLAGARETTVPLADLSGKVRHVIARQQAHWFAMAMVVFVALILVGDVLLNRRGWPAGGTVPWGLWGPALAVALLSAAVAWRTRRPLAWTLFQPNPGRPGLYVLRDPRRPDDHARFVAAVAQRLPRP